MNPGNTTWAWRLLCLGGDWKGMRREKVLPTHGLYSVDPGEFHWDTWEESGTSKMATSLARGSPPGGSFDSEVVTIGLRFSMCSPSQGAMTSLGNMLEI